MNEGTVGTSVFVATTLAVSLMTHALTQRHWPASFVASALASLIFQVMSYVHLGHLDPFAPIAFVIGCGLALPIAFGVGILFSRRRDRRVRAERQ
jgi:uncharacterized membrane protein YhhN